MVYKNLVPCAEKCPNIVAGMICYAAKKPENHSEKLIRRKILKIFMERLSGENISYARLCLAYGKDMQLDKALEICKKNESSEAYDIIQKIYRKKINNALVNGMAGSSDKNTVLNRLKEIKNMMEQVIRYCGKYRETVLNTDELLSYKKDDSYAGRLADLTFAFECAIIGRMFAERNLIPWKWGSGRVGTFFAAVCAEL